MNFNNEKQNRSSRLSALTLVACLGLACPCLSDAFSGEQFLPDYLYPDSHMNTRDIAGSGESRHFSAYGYDNDDLDQAAENFSDNRLNTTQRLLNHQWLYYQYHDKKWKKGTKVFNKMLKAGAKAYWDKVHSRKFKNNSAVPNGSGEGQLAEVSYRMRLNDSSLKLFVSYEF